MLDYGLPNSGVGKGILGTKNPSLTGIFQNLVGPGELESPTPAMSRRYSNQLSYGPKFLFLAI